MKEELPMLCLNPYSTGSDSLGKHIVSQQCDTVHGLNPYSTGSDSLGELTVFNNSKFGGLNPYSTGSDSLGWMYISCMHS